LDICTVPNTLFLDPKIFEKFWSFIWYQVLPLKIFLKTKIVPDTIYGVFRYSIKILITHSDYKRKRTVDMPLLLEKKRLYNQRVCCGDWKSDIMSSKV
jgi:hypothetical protein